MQGIGLDGIIRALNDKKSFRDVKREAKKSLIDFVAGSEAGRKIFRHFGEQYIAGASFDKGLDEIESYLEKGRCCTIDILGESAKNAQEADRYFHSYLKLVDLIHERFSKSYDAKRVSVSLKPSSISYIEFDGETPAVSQQTPFLERLESIVKKAGERGIDVTLDMEDHRFTDLSLDAAKRLWGKGHKNFGIVLQSCLNRTESDVENILKNGTYGLEKSSMASRFVRGIYVEPENIATQDIEEAKERLLKIIPAAYDAGIRVQAATHDPKIIWGLIDRFIIPNSIDRKRFEFQVLKGVPNSYTMERYLMSLGFDVRYYMPIEINQGDGTPYIIRRMKESDNIIRYGIKNFFQNYIRIR